jgi:chromosome segregation ATPase
VVEEPKLRRSLFGYRRAQVRETFEDLDRRISQAWEDAAQARSRAEDIDAKLATTRNELALAVVQRDAAKMALERRGGELAAERASVLGLKAELASTRGELDARDHQVRSLDLELTELRGRVEAAIGREQQLMADIHASRADLEATRTELTISREETHAALNRARDAEAVAADVRRRLTLNPEPTAASTPSAASTEELIAALDSAEGAIARVASEASSKAKADVRNAELQKEAAEAEAAALEAWRAEVAPTIGILLGAVESARHQAVDLHRRIDEAVAPTSKAMTRLTERLRDLSSVTPPPGIVPTERRSIVIPDTEPAQDEDAEDQAKVSTKAGSEPTSSPTR